MARDKNVTLVPGKGEYWTAPVGTPFPTDPTAPIAPWTEVGHTSRETPMQVARNGGETTTRGSWQDANMRADVAPPTYSIAFNLLQYDEEGLKLYYGSNATVNAAGRVQIPKNPVATECALFLRIVDGTKEQPRYYERVSIIGADSEEFDIENLASLPVAATILGNDGDDHLGEIGVPAVPTPAVP